MISEAEKAKQAQDKDSDDQLFDKSLLPIGVHEFFVKLTHGDRVGFGHTTSGTCDGKCLFVFIDPSSGPAVELMLTSGRVSMNHAMVEIASLRAPDTRTRPAQLCAVCKSRSFVRSDSVASHEGQCAQ